MSLGDKIVGYFKQRNKKEVEPIIIKSEPINLRKEAKAIDPGFTSWYMGDGNTGIFRGARLSYKELEEIYFQSSVIRAIVDGITKTISSFDWNFTAMQESEGIDKLLVSAKAFFMDINENSESFSNIIRKLVRDLLIYDAAVIEKTFNKDGTILELFARDASTFEVSIDRHGIIQGYNQKVYTPSEQSVNFSPDEIIYMVLNARTSSPYGAPALDSLTNEISAAMFASQLIAKSFEYDEVPPGILNLGKIGQVAYDRAREYFKEKRGSGRKNFELTIVHDTDNVEWIPLTKDPQELQLSELIDKVNRMIFRCFGVTPTEMGSVEDINRATAQVQENISRSKLIIPIIRMLEEYINSEVIWRHLSPAIRLEFKAPKEVNPDLVLDECKIFTDTGIWSVNDARKKLGDKPIPGGEKYYKTVGNSVYELTNEGLKLLTNQIGT
jgi:HK97 family phage portal protein